MTYRIGVLLVISKRSMLLRLLGAWLAGVLSAFVLAGMLPAQNIQTSSARSSSIKPSSWCARPPAPSSITSKSI